MPSAQRLTVGRVQVVTAATTTHYLIDIERQAVGVTASVLAHHASAITQQDLTAYLCAHAVISATFLTSALDRCQPRRQAGTPQGLATTDHRVTCCWCWITSSGRSLPITQHSIRESLAKEVMTTTNDP